MIESMYETRAGEYRTKADTLLLLAAQTKFPEGRARLLALAESFKRLADHVESRNDMRLAAN
jgi:hypothetical protein